MKRRWRLWLGLTLLLRIGGASFLLPAVRWRVIGWAKGEAFYDGRPTSYWSWECREVKWIEFGGARYMISYRWREPTWLEHFAQLLGMRLGPTGGTLPFQRGDPLSVPVLIELLKDDEQDVRIIALQGLRTVGEQAQPAVPVLLEMAREGGELQWEARQALRTIDPEAAGKAWE